MSEMRLLRSVGADGGPTASEVEAARTHARERLLGAIAREEAARAPAGWAGRLREVIVRRRIVFAGAAAALALVLAAGIAFSALRPPAAAARLDRLAVVAEGAQQPAPTGEDVAYSVSESLELVQQIRPGGETLSFLAASRTERWVDASGSLRVRREFGPPAFFRPEDEAAFLAAGLEEVYGAGVVSDDVFEERSAAEPGLAEWRTDPDELRSQMLAALGDAGDDEVPRAARMLDLGAGLLQAFDATPELRAAVLRVLADEEGLTTADTVTPGGAEGVSVAVDYADGGARFMRALVFDAATAHLAEDTLVTQDELPGGIPADTVLSRRVNLPTVTRPAFDAPVPTG